MLFIHSKHHPQIILHTKYERMKKMAQNNQSQRKEFCKEVCKLLKDFVRRDFIKDKILEQPKYLKKTALKLNRTALIMNCIFALFSYLTLAGNYAIEHGLGILGIALYMVYAAQSIVHIVYNQWNQNISTEFEFVKEDSLTMIGSKILAKVSWNVYQQQTRKSQVVLEITLLVTGI